MTNTPSLTGPTLLGGVWPCRQCCLSLSMPYINSSAYQELSKRSVSKLCLFSGWIWICFKYQQCWHSWIIYSLIHSFIHRLRLIPVIGRGRAGADPSSHSWINLCWNVFGRKIRWVTRPLSNYLISWKEQSDCNECMMTQTQWEHVQMKWESQSSQRLWW